MFNNHKRTSKRGVALSVALVIILGLMPLGIGSALGASSSVVSLIDNKTFTSDVNAGGLGTGWQILDNAVDFSDKTPSRMYLKFNVAINLTENKLPSNYICTGDREGQNPSNTGNTVDGAMNKLFNSYANNGFKVQLGSESNSQYADFDLGYHTGIAKGFNTVLLSLENFMNPTTGSSFNNAVINGVSRSVNFAGNNWNYTSSWSSIDRIRMNIDSISYEFKKEIQEQNLAFSMQVSNFEIVEADTKDDAVKSVLEGIVAEQRTADDYNAGSWAEYETAKNAASAVLSEGGTNEQIIAEILSMTRAINNLILPNDIHTIANWSGKMLATNIPTNYSTKAGAINLDTGWVAADGLTAGSGNAGVDLSVYSGNYNDLYVQLGLKLSTNTANLDSSYSEYNDVINALPEAFSGDAFLLLDSNAGTGTDAHTKCTSWNVGSSTPLQAGENTVLIPLGRYLNMSSSEASGANGDSVVNGVMKNNTALGNSDITTDSSNTTYSQNTPNVTKTAGSMRFIVSSINNSALADAYRAGKINFILTVSTAKIIYAKKDEVYRNTFEMIKSKVPSTPKADDVDSMVPYELLAEKLETANSAVVSISDANFNTVSGNISSKLNVLKQLTDEAKTAVTEMETAYWKTDAASAEKAAVITSMTNINTSLKAERDGLYTSIASLVSAYPETAEAAQHIKGIGGYITNICGHLDWFTNPSNKTNIDNDSDSSRFTSIRNEADRAAVRIIHPTDAIFGGAIKSLTSQINYVQTYKSSEVVKQWVKNSNYSPVVQTLNNDSEIQNGWNNWNGENDASYNIDVSKYDPDGLYLKFNYNVELTYANGFNIDDPANKALKDALPTAFKANGIFLRLDATENHDWHSQFHIGNTGAIAPGMNEIVIPLGAYFAGAGTATKPNDGLVPVISNGVQMDNSKLYLNQKDLSPRSEKTLGRIAFIYKNDSGIKDIAGTDKVTAKITIDNVHVYYEEPVNEPDIYESQLSVSSVSFTKGLDNPTAVTTLQTGFIQGTFIIKNDVNRVQPAVFIMMLKKKPDSSVEDIVVIPKSFAANGVEMLTGGFNIPANYQDYKIEVVIWDSIANKELLYQSEFK